MNADDEVALTRHLDFMRLRGLAPGTVTKRAQDVRRLEHQLPGTLLRATERELSDWQLSIEHYSPKYRSAWVSQVACFYRWAFLHQYMTEELTQHLVRPKVPRALPRPIAEDDLDVAIACAPERLRPWLILAAFAGLRCAEIANLTRADILDRAEPPVMLLRGKGNKQRVVPLSQLVLGELRAAGMPNRGPLYRCTDGTGRPVPPHRVSQELNKYLHGMGITDTAHSLRHRAATRLYRATKDLRLVQEFLGHSSPATTAGYAAYSPATMASAIAALDDDGGRAHRGQQLAAS